jgi:hypothetical protein
MNVFVRRKIALLNFCSKWPERGRERGGYSVESGCVTFAFSIRAMCKDLWKLLHDIYTSVLTEWNYESISYKPCLTTREMPRITHFVYDVSVVTCLIRNGHIYTSNL